MTNIADEQKALEWVVYFTECRKIKCPHLCLDGCRLGTDTQDCTLEVCFQCGKATGRTRDGDDSLYIDNDLGPFCWDCYWEKYVD